MKAENRALLALVVAAAVVLTPIGAYLLLQPSAPPNGLPVPAGTEFSATQVANWTVHFTVDPGGGTLVGAWTAYDGSGFIGLVVVNGTVSKPPPYVLLCPLLHAWTQLNGTADQALSPGPYTLYWTAGICSSASRIVVTQTIQVAPS